MTPASPSIPRLSLQGICKNWPGVRANDDVSLDVMPGQIHGLIGENGAGKSTLMKIACGLIRPDAGRLLWEGQAVAPDSPRQARGLGIGMVFQHFALFESLTVLDNVALALQGASADTPLAARVRDCGQRYGLPVNPMAIVHDLSTGERQRVEIIRNLLFAPRLLILDEPTSVLTPDAVAGLFNTLRVLQAEGTSILYISHKLHEIRALCSKATVMRAGRVVGSCDPRVVGEAALSQMMLGAAPPTLARVDVAQTRKVRLSVMNLEAPALDAHSMPVQVPTLTVAGAEIVGVAGVSGNGQNALLDLLSGERLLDARDGRAVGITLDGMDVMRIGVHGRRQLGLAFIPEERIGRGAVPHMTLVRNGLLTHDEPAMTRRGWLHMTAARRLAETIKADFDVRARNVQALAAQLSGGNLQKFIVGRELVKQPAVLLVAQPTWGVDVGASARIRQALLDLRAQGAAILLVSEDLDELFELSDAICVMSQGRLSAPIRRADCHIADIGRLMGAGVA